MDPLDWNWFFSSTAQSAAAITGIFGAFIIAKIVDNERAYRRTLVEVDILEQKARDLRDRVSDLSIAWVNEDDREDALRDISKEVADAVRTNKKLKSPEGYLAGALFSIYDHHGEILDAIDEILSRPKRSPERQGVLPPTDLTTGFLREIPSPARIQAIKEERRRIDERYAEARSHAAKASYLLDHLRSNPEQSPILAWSALGAALLFTVGVVYPLSFLPSSGIPRLSLSAFFDILFSLRGLILFSISVVFGTGLLMFFVVNRRHKYGPKILERIDPWTRMVSYAEYFENRVRNEKWFADYFRREFSEKNPQKA